MKFLLDKIVLFPYYLTLLIRNSLYDRGILKSFKPDIPTICIGNITVGGTGKTPMTELLIREYKDTHRIAVVSRGYKRKTHELRDVSVLDSYLLVGDEPLQIKKKFPDIRVMVDANRRRAITYLQALPETEHPDLIILDDAFQHRSITPHFSMVLVDSHRPIFEDSLLPFGRLRDLPNQICRADMVVVTKLEEVPDERQRLQWRKKLKLPQGTSLLCSKITYKEPLPVFKENADCHYIYAKSAILFSGIANDKNIKREVGRKYKLIRTLKYSDHHDFTAKDLREVAVLAKANPMAVVLTTEKDAQRLVSLKDIAPELKSRLFYLPIESEIIPTTMPQGSIEEEAAGYGIKELKSLITI